MKREGETSKDDEIDKFIDVKLSLFVPYQSTSILSYENKLTEDAVESVELVTISTPLLLSDSLLIVENLGKTKKYISHVSSEHKIDQKKTNSNSMEDFTSEKFIPKQAVNVNNSTFMQQDVDDDFANILKLLVDDEEIVEFENLSTAEFDNSSSSKNKSFSNLIVNENQKLNSNHLYQKLDSNYLGNNIILSDITEIVKRNHIYYANNKSIHFSHIYEWILKFQKKKKK
jgi:hypothetical protein